MKWIETSTLLADGLTKKMKSQQLYAFLETGFSRVDLDRSHSKKEEQKLLSQDFHTVSASQV